MSKKETMTPEKAITLVMEELSAAEQKHPGWPVDPIHGAAIVAEEAGELSQATIDHIYAGDGIEHAIKEAAQTAAVSIRFILAADYYCTAKALQIKAHATNTDANNDAE